MADKYPNISPYAYCGWNPIKHIDPNGKWVETAWDIANIGKGIASLKSNVSAGNVVWRKSEGHRAKSAEHTKAWDDFFADPQNKNCTKEQVLDYRDKVENNVWHNTCDLE